jgi:hypothetical protein
MQEQTKFTFSEDEIVKIVKDYLTTKGVILERDEISFKFNIIDSFKHEEIGPGHLKSVPVKVFSNLDITLHRKHDL